MSGLMAQSKLEPSPSRVTCIGLVSTADQSLKSPSTVMVVNIFGLLGVIILVTGIFMLFRTTLTRRRKRYVL